MADDDRKETINNIGKLIRDSWDKGEPAGWFEEVYANAVSGTGVVPWAFMQPSEMFTEWAQATNLDGEDKTALVVGCGLGDDAEGLAGYGFNVTAFDISHTAIKQCKERFPKTTVTYQQADLLNLPDEWRGKFDFVLENRTIQALPFDLAERVISIISGLVADDGRVLVLCHGRDPEQEATGIPWALSSTELAYFEQNGLKQIALDEFDDNFRRFRVVFQRDTQE